jgi:hypothetical protein
MSNKTKTIFIGFLIVFIFILAVIAYFFVYQNFINKKGSSLVVTDDRPVVSDGLSFQAEINRFLSVYDTQEFSNQQDLYNFLVLEWNRFLMYPAQTKEEKSLKLVLTKNIKEIIIKMEKGDSSIAEEQANLKSLLTQ